MNMCVESIWILRASFKVIVAPSHYVNKSCSNAVWLTAQTEGIPYGKYRPKRKFR